MPTLDEIKKTISQMDGGSVFLARKEIKELPSILWEDEYPEKIIQGMYSDRLGILVCTNSRLIFVDKGLIFGLKVEDFPLKNVSSIQFETKMLFGKVTIFASGNKADIEQVDKKQARSFAEYVRAKITAMETRQAVTNTVSNTDDMISKLERLAALKEKGILTESEFLEQKQKILNG